MLLHSGRISVPSFLLRYSRASPNLSMNLSPVYNKFGVLEREIFFSRQTIMQYTEMELWGAEISIMVRVITEGPINGAI